MRRMSTLVLSALLFVQIASLAGCKSDAERAQEAQAVESARAAEVARQQQQLIQAQRAAEEEEQRRQATQYKEAIEKALHEDLLTGKDASSGHITAMRSIDLSQCPAEFRVAYVKHIHAWEEAVAVVRAKSEVDSEGDSAAAAGLLSTVFGSDATPYADHIKAEHEVATYQAIASADITSTFQAVELVAAQYNAQVPQQR